MKIWLEKLIRKWFFVPLDMFWFFSELTFFSLNKKLHKKSQRLEIFLDRNCIPLGFRTE